MRLWPEKVTRRMITNLSGSECHSHTKNRLWPSHIDKTKWWHSSGTQPATWWLSQDKCYDTWWLSQDKCHDTNKEDGALSYTPLKCAWKISQDFLKGIIPSWIVTLNTSPTYIFSCSFHTAYLVCWWSLSVGKEDWRGDVDCPCATWPNKEAHRRLNHFLLEKNWAIGPFWLFIYLFQETSESKLSWLFNLFYHNKKNKLQKKKKKKVKIIKYIF